MTRKNDRRDQVIYDRGFESGFRACLDQIAFSGLTPTSESTVREFVEAARRRMGMGPSLALEPGQETS